MFFKAVYRCFADTTPEQSSPTLVPVARNDSMIVLSTNTPVRPKIASMQSVLDPSQIDMSLYKFVSIIFSWQ